MAPKSNNVVHRCGLVEYAPNTSTKPYSTSGLVEYAPRSGTKSVSVYKAGQNSYEMQKSSKTIQKDTYGGSTTTKKYSETSKGGEFVDRRSGNNGYQQEYKWQTTDRVNNKAEGYTKEIQTEVKIKEKTTYHKSNPTNYSYNRLPEKSSNYYENDYDVSYDRDSDVSYGNDYGDCYDDDDYY